jgi:APA family basic amino acid/polyamine antiporter
VIVVYLSVNYVCVHALGAEGLAHTKTPASAVMRLALGEKGARFLAAGIAISTIGFLSQSMLTAPRVYFAMADDGLFFKELAWLNRRVPAMRSRQGSPASHRASGAATWQIHKRELRDGVFPLRLRVVVFRKTRVRRGDFFCILWLPVTTMFFILACCVITKKRVYRNSRNSAILRNRAGGRQRFVWAWGKGCVQQREAWRGSRTCAPWWLNLCCTLQAGAGPSALRHVANLNLST